MRCGPAEIGCRHFDGFRLGREQARVLELDGKFFARLEDEYLAALFAVFFLDDFWGCACPAGRLDNAETTGVVDIVTSVIRQQRPELFLLVSGSLKLFF